MKKTIAAAAGSLMLLVAVTSEARKGEDLSARPDMHYLNEKGQLERGVRCGVPDATAEEVARVRSEIRRFVAENGRSLMAGGTLVIPVAWHVIYGNNGQGNIP